MSNIKYCPNCGKQTGKEAKFCRDCGFKFNMNIQMNEAHLNHNSSQMQMSSFGQAQQNNMQPGQNYGQAQQNNMQPGQNYGQAQTGFNNQWQSWGKPTRKTIIALVMAFVLLFTAVFTGFIYPRWIPRMLWRLNPKITGGNPSIGLDDGNDDEVNIPPETMSDAMIDVLDRIEGDDAKVWYILTELDKFHAGEIELPGEVYQYYEEKLEEILDGNMNIDYEMDGDGNIISRTWNGIRHTPDEFEGFIDTGAAVKSSNYEPMLTDTSEFKPVMISGSSDPFDIEPFEGFHIKGDKDVLDQNREIKVTDIDDDAFNSLENKIHEQMDSSSDLLFAFDIDMGLEQDEQLPGKYEISVDLNKLGLTGDSQCAVSIVRYSEKWDRVEELASTLDNGVLKAYCSQNSAFGVAWSMIKAIGTIDITGGGLGAAVTTGLGIGAVMLVFPLAFFAINRGKQYWYFVKNKRIDAFTIKEVGKPYSLIFCWDDVMTEGDNASREIDGSTGKYLVWYALYADQMQKTYNKANEAYEKAIKSEIKDSPEKATVLQKLIERLHQRRRYVQTHDKALFIQEYAKQDRALQDLKKQFKLPKSVQIISQDLDISFEYFNEQKIKRPNYVLQYQILPHTEFKAGLTDFGSKLASNLHRAYMQLNVDSLFVDGNKSKGIDESKNDGMLLTCTHETLHACQAEYVKNKYIIDASDIMGIEFGIGNLGRQFSGNPKLEEAMAAVFEYDAASDYYNRGLIKVAPTLDSSTQAWKNLGLVSRSETQYHAIPFRADIDKSRGTMEGQDAWYKTLGETQLSVNAGYAFSSLIDYLRENQYKASMSEILNAYYKNNNKNIETLMEAFKIKDTERFDELWMGYCRDYAPIIYHGMVDGGWDSLKQNFAYTYKDLELVKGFNVDHPFLNYNVAKDNYTDTVFRIKNDSKIDDSKKGDRSTLKRRFSLVAYPNEEAQNDKYTQFYFLNSIKGQVIIPVPDKTYKYIRQGLYWEPKNDTTDSYDKDFALVETNEKANDSEGLPSYKLVAYFEPDQPTVKVDDITDDFGITKDAYLVFDVPEPSQQLKNSGRIAGLMTIIKNKETGKDYNIDTKVDDKEIGSTQKINMMKLGVHWMDKTQPVDLEIYQYWYYYADFGEVRSPNSVSVKIQRDKEEKPEEPEEPEKPEEPEQPREPEKPDEPNGSSNDEEKGQFLMWPCRAPLDGVKDIHKEVYTSPTFIECDSGSVTFTFPRYSRDIDNGSPVHEEWSPYTITINNIKKSESMYQGGGYIWSTEGIENIHISPITHMRKGTMIDRETKEKKSYTETTTYSMPSKLETGRDWDFSCELLRSEHGNWYVAYIRLYVDVESKDTSDGSETHSKDLIGFKFTSNEKEARYEDALSHKGSSTGSVDFEW